MKRIVIESWLLLLFVELVVRFRGFKGLHTTIRNKNTKPRHDATFPSTTVLCHAADVACAFYFKQVLCLQRSAATTLLLRRHGRQAEMVIGASLLPFQSHAWVELEGQIVNDGPYISKLYRALERC